MNEIIVPTRLNVNMDIMLAILSHSPPKTATSIMATCHLLYHEGAKIILQQRVSLHGSDQEVLALLRFIQAEDLTRCSYVRILFVFTLSLSEAAVNALTVIVPRMCNLVDLCLPGEHLFKVYPSLLPAFASLRSVRVFMVGAGNRSYELLRMIRSELVSVEILSTSANPPGIGQDPSAAFHHPLYLLRQFASTLQNLACVEIQTVSPPPRIIYPKVHTLALYSDQLVPLLPPYIAAFPNLVHLSIVTLRPINGALLALPLSQNQAQTTTMPEGHTKDPLVWKHIQTYTGTLSHLHALGITFPIPRLYLTALPGAPYIPALTEVLAHVQPVHLTITYEDQPFSHIPASPDLLAALRSDGASRLQSFALRIDLMAADVDSGFDVGQFWADLEAALKRLKLSALCISMRDISLPAAASPSTAVLPSNSTASGTQPSGHVHVRMHPDGTESSAVSVSVHDADGPVQVDPANPTRITCPWPESCLQCAEARRASLTLAERTLEDFDVGAFVDRLSAAIPTFQRAVVSVAGPSRYRWSGSPRVRTACLGKYDGLQSEMRVQVEEDFFIEALVQKGLMKPMQSFAAMARAWYHGQAVQG